MHCQFISYIIFKYKILLHIKIQISFKVIASSFLFKCMICSVICLSNCIIHCLFTILKEFSSRHIFNLFILYSEILMVVKFEFNIRVVSVLEDIIIVLLYEKKKSDALKNKFFFFTYQFVYPKWM